MKKTRGIIFIFLLILVMGVNVFAESEIKIKYNGVFLESDTPPVIENDRVLVPLRVVSENLGAVVEWKEETKEIILTRGSETIVFQIGVPKYIKDGSEFLLDVEPKIINSRTMVPLRAAAEALGEIVNWDGGNRIVLIGENPAPVVAPIPEPVALTAVPQPENTPQVIENNEEKGIRPTGWQDPKDPAWKYSNGLIIGNRNSMKYHLPTGKSYRRVSVKNAVFFNTEQEARDAGFVRAGDS